MTGTGYDSDQAVAALRAVVAEHGTAGLSNAQLMSGVLKDLMPDAQRETNILIQAAQSGLPELLSDRLSQGLSLDAALATTANMVSEHTGLASDACAWAASVTATVLGLAGPAAQQAPQDVQQPPQDWQPQQQPDWQPQPAQDWRQPDLAGVAAGSQQTQLPDSPPAAPPAPFAATQLSPGNAEQATVYGAVPQAPIAGQVPPQAGAGYAASPQWPQGGGPAGSPWQQPQPPAPAGGQPGNRRNLTIAGVAVVVIALIIGVVVWAPWKSNSVAAPAGLTAGTATANSLQISWTAPATAPSKYDVYRDGTLIGHIAGTDTEFTDSGLSPATSYKFQLVAVDAGTSSPRSAVVRATTMTPPLTAAVLDGPYTVSYKVIQSNPHDPIFRSKGQTWTDQWVVTPCTAAACKTAHLVGKLHGYKFSTTLYKIKDTKYPWFGQVNTSFELCGHGSKAPAVPATISILMKLTQAGPHGTAWQATNWTGVVKVVQRRINLANGDYCNGYATWANVAGAGS